MKLPEELTRGDPEAACAFAREAPSDARDALGAGAPDWLRFLAEPRYAWPILLIVGVALYLVNLGSYPLYTKGEPREAVTVFDIVHGGGVILPQRAGVEIPSKPLLMHWIAALVSLAAGGVNEFTVRLPSAGFAIAGVIVCYFYVRRLFDSVTALIAAMVLATTFQYLQAGTGARVDMTLTFFEEVAFFEFIMMAEGLTRRRMILYVAIALAVLTKGPIGLLLPGLVGLIWIALEKRWSMLGRMSLVRGAIVVLVLAGGWYVGALMEGGAGFFRKQIVAENLLRLSGGSNFHEGHVHSFYYMELALMAGFMPWTIILPFAAIQAVPAPRPLDPRFKYILVWCAAVLIFYNIPQSKRGVYLLSMYPGLATLAAIYFRRAMTRPEPVRAWVGWLARFSGLAMLTLGLGGLIALVILVARPAEFAAIVQAAGIRAPDFPYFLSLAVHENWLLDIAMPLGVVALGVLTIFARPRIEPVVLAVAGAMVLITVAVNAVVVPALANTLSLRRFTDQAMKIVDRSPVAYLGMLNYDVAFYSGRTIPIVWPRSRELPQYLITWQPFLDALPAARRSRYEVVLKSNPTSLDGTDEMLLVRRRAGGRDPAPTPSDGYIEAGISTTSPVCATRRPPSPAAAIARPTCRASLYRISA